MSDVLEYPTFKKTRRQALKDPQEQIDEIASRCTAAILVAREKLTAARQRLDGETDGQFIDWLNEVLDGIEAAARLLDRLDLAAPQDESQWKCLRDLLRTLCIHLSNLEAALALEYGEPARFGGA